MNPERSEKWRPPKKNHGGEDIPDLFARWLAGEMVAIMTVGDPSGDFRAAEDVLLLYEEIQRITARLKDGGNYFRGTDGSVFICL